MSGARLDTFGGRMVGPIEGLTEKALQRVGNWPGGPVDAQQFLALLEALIEQEPDEERRGWLTAMRDGVRKRTRKRGHGCPERVPRSVRHHACNRPAP
jgi:hypothetical protein